MCTASASYNCINFIIFSHSLPLLRAYPGRCDSNTGVEYLTRLVAAQANNYLQAPVLFTQIALHKSVLLLRR